MEHGRWPGTYKVVCDVCGFEYPSDMVRKRWDGLIVCAADWELKHPQLSIRVQKEEIGVPFARPEAEDEFIEVCTVITSSCYAGLATADCAIADNQRFTYAYLLEMNGGVFNT